MALTIQPAVADLGQIHRTMTMTMVVVSRVGRTSKEMAPLGAGTNATTMGQTGIPQRGRMGVVAMAHMKKGTSVYNRATVANIGQNSGNNGATVADIIGAKAIRSGGHRTLGHSEQSRTVA